MARSEWEAWLQQAPERIEDEEPERYAERCELRERLHSLYRDMIEYLRQQEKRGGNTWALAAFAVWRSLPKQLRQPRTQNELAALLGFTSDNVFYKWMNQYPELFITSSAGMEAMIREFLPDVLWASIASAKHGGTQGFQDRKMLLTMGGMVTDKSERTIVGDKDRPIAVTNLDELTDEELAAIAMGEA